ncbi:phosphonate C-P lyase system protein PhnL [Burkholderia oklahomensis]|uniref:phosphonate C-P lyase system protein PhnL n=1 Tax=Burkholderia oklahomensis TaxID=342113 RepID=UPI00265481EF|nr:phosphonate C-P lyase system protein PhnL [Burkholderia oklahomensis]MDN7673405.1 phosphonate C-P lyase system protein PhnL [Burkholderia oklahomensis]
MTDTSTMISVRGLGKTFTLHNQGGVRLPVLDAVDFDAAAGDCLILSGPSGAGKSTLLRCLYGNYLPTEGSIRVRMPAGKTGAADAPWLELVGASEQAVLHARQVAIGYVSQFLRAIPRIGALHVVAEPLLQRGVSRPEAEARAAALLERLRLPARLWHLPPATFSGGEQQRVNIARGFIGAQPILLLDEPTASLDAENAAVVIDLIRDACAADRCLIGIFHDRAVREAVGTRALVMNAPEAATQPHPPGARASSQSPQRIAADAAQPG